MSRVQPTLLGLVRVDLNQALSIETQSPSLILGEILFHYPYPLGKTHKQIRPTQHATFKPKSRLKLDECVLVPLRIPPHSIALVLSKKPSTLATALAVAKHPPTICKALPACDSVGYQYDLLLPAASREFMPQGRGQYGATIYLH